MTMQVQVEEPAVAVAPESAAVAEPAVVQEVAAAVDTATAAPELAAAGYAAMAAPELAAAGYAAMAAPELAAAGYAATPATGDVTAGRERRKFTVAEYYRMGEVGILHHTERVELIDGEVIVMSPVGVPHVTVVNLLTMAFAEQARGRYIVSVQNPVHLDDYGEPQPDLVLLRPRDYYAEERHPGPGDTLLAVEVADSTLAFDLAGEVAAVRGRRHSGNVGNEFAGGLP